MAFWKNIMGHIIERFLMQVYKNLIDQVKFDDLAECCISSQQFPWYYNYIVEKKI